MRRRHNRTCFEYLIALFFYILAFMPSSLRSVLVTSTRPLSSFTHRHTHTDSHAIKQDSKVNHALWLCQHEHGGTVIHDHGIRKSQQLRTTHTHTGARARKMKYILQRAYNLVLPKNRKIQKYATVIQFAFYRCHRRHRRLWHAIYFPCAAFCFDSHYR